MKLQVRTLSMYIRVWVYKYVNDFKKRLNEIYNSLTFTHSLPWSLNCFSLDFVHCIFDFHKFELNMIKCVKIKNS